MTDTPSARLPDALHILLVEDDPATQQLVPAMLPDGWSCEVASAAAEARAAMRSTSYDVALIDIRLETREGGLELFEEMAEADYWADTSAIAVTAYALPGDQERFLEAGFDAYVAKPFAKDQLLGAIEDALA